MTHASCSRIFWPALAAAAALGAYGAWAAHVVGSVRSSSSFQLSGTAVPVEGTRSWPVTPGDEILAGSEPAILELTDGTRVTLEAGARVKIEARNERTTVRLLDGALHYQLSDTPRTELYNRTARAPGRSGNLSTPGKRHRPKPPGHNHPGPPPPASPWR
ncbi:MAG TPA: hypothetical protein VHA11_01860 [Bryobacteraceae bacterium]|nr:hypothetical protein [Bryobacteraceae bacterium]